MRMRMEPRAAGLFRLYRQLAASTFPDCSAHNWIAPHITGAFHRMPAEPVALTASQGVLTPNSSNQRQFILFRQVSVRKHDGQRR